MGPTVAPLIDTLLGLSMIGVAAAIHFRPRRHGHHPRHRVRVRMRARPSRFRFRLRWVPVPLAVAGLAIIVAGWLRFDDAMTESANGDALRLEAIGGGANGADGAVHGFVLIRGTPTDDDTANEGEIRNYSLRLGTLLAQTLARPPVALRLEPRALDATEWSTIQDDPNQARKWCDHESKPAFVAVIGMGALQLDNGAGYAPWREPEYLIASCASPRLSSSEGRVDERPGDRVPYEQAITDDLRSALGKLAARQD